VECSDCLSASFCGGSIETMDIWANDSEKESNEEESIKVQLVANHQTLSKPAKANKSTKLVQ